MSVMLLMAMPGAISIHSDAMERTGGKPRPVTPMKAASCGCKLSRNANVRRVIERSAMSRRLQERCRSVRARASDGLAARRGGERPSLAAVAAVVEDATSTPIHVDILRAGGWK